MSDNRQSLISLIVDRLKTVSSLHNRVYDYEPDKFSGFPTVCVKSNGYIDKVANTNNNLREYLFDIYVYVDRTKLGTNASDSERIQRELEDEILSVFDNYRDLDGNCLWIEHTSGGWAYSSDDSIAFFVINFSAIKSVIITI